MKTTIRTALTAAFGAAVIGFGSSQASATIAQITTLTNNGVYEDFHGGTHLAPNPSDNNTTSANGITTYTGQAWDLEAFTVKTAPDGAQLNLVAGYDLAATGGNFTTGNGTGGYYGTGGGDIFISLSGGATDLPNTGLGYATYSNNNGSGGKIYDYVISAHSGLSGAGTLNVYALSLTSKLTGVENPGLNSNPWMFQAGVDGNTSTVFKTLSYTYSANQTAAAIATATGVLSMGGLKDDNISWGVSGGVAPWGDQHTNGLDHNLLAIDMTNLVAALSASSSLYFSYTMECGNDSIKGKISGGFSTVPDGVSTLILLGAGVSFMALARRKTKNAA